jgi:hypothetical protein
MNCRSDGNGEVCKPTIQWVLSLRALVTGSLAAKPRA